MDPNLLPLLLDDNDEEGLVLLHMQYMHYYSSMKWKEPTHKVSVVGRKVVRRDFHEPHERLMKDYFSDKLVYEAKALDNASE